MIGNILGFIGLFIICSVFWAIFDKEDKPDMQKILDDLKYNLEIVLTRYHKNEKKTFFQSQTKYNTCFDKHNSTLKQHLRERDYVTLKKCAKTLKAYEWYASTHYPKGTEEEVEKHNDIVKYVEETLITYPTITKEEK